MKVEIFGKNSCPYCNKAKQACEAAGIEFTYVDILDPASGVTKADVQSRINALGLNYEVKTVPQIFIDDNHIGGYDSLVQRFPWARAFNDKR